MVQDSMEGYALCGQSLFSHRHPCRLCWITFDDSGNPILPVVQNRYAVQNQNLVRLLRTKIRRADSKETTFSEFGLLNVDSAFTDVPFGANLHGINGAALGDILHQYLLGIMKRLVINLLELIVSTTNPLILMKRKVKEKKKEDAAKREQLLADLSASKAASVM
jgi:hypothetical protein